MAENMDQNIEVTSDHLAQKYHFMDELLRVIIDAIPANVFFKDTSCRYQMASHVCSHLNGDIIGKTDLEVQKDPELAKFFYEDDKMILATGKTNRYISEMVFSGEKYYYEIIKTPVFDMHGSSIGIVGLVNDVTEMTRLQEELRLIGITDKLTGVYNRTYFEQRVDQLLSSGNDSIAVITCDSNGLKYFNDNFGHKKGDELLIETANIIKSVIGDDGDIMRIGGDEFIVFCPDRNDEWCAAAVERLRAAERGCNVVCLPVSNAYGYAVLSDSQNDLNAAINSAEDMMYRDKAAVKEEYICQLKKLAAESCD